MPRLGGQAIITCIFNRVEWYMFLYNGHVVNTFYTLLHAANGAYISLEVPSSELN